MLRKISKLRNDSKVTLVTSFKSKYNSLFYFLGIMKNFHEIPIVFLFPREPLGSFEAEALKRPRVFVSGRRSHSDDRKKHLEELDFACLSI